MRGLPPGWTAEQRDILTSPVETLTDIAAVYCGNRQAAVKMVSGARVAAAATPARPVTSEPTDDEIYDLLYGS